MHWGDCGLTMPLTIIYCRLFIMKFIYIEHRIPVNTVTDIICQWTCYYATVRKSMS